MSGPVSVVAGVDGKVVTDAVAPTVGVFGLFDAAVIVVVVEVDVCVIEFKEQPVLKVGVPLLCSKVCIDVRLDVERLAIELAVVVDIGIILACEVIADPVFVVNIHVS